MPFLGCPRARSLRENSTASSTSEGTACTRSSSRSRGGGAAPARYTARHLSKRDPTGDFMAVERTFSMIKPDATARNLTGKIVAKLEDAGLRIVAQKRGWMSRKQAGGFYAVHRSRPFFDE